MYATYNANTGYDSSNNKVEYILKERVPGVSTETVVTGQRKTLFNVLNHAVTRKLKFELEDDAAFEEYLSSE